MRPNLEPAAPGFRPGMAVGGHFRVEAPLGQGGVASVFRVRDERSGTRLALKQLRLRGDSQDPLLATMFEREYHTLCQLAHPHIIEVYDYGIEDGSPYYTMELLDGQDLFERGKLGWREACVVLCDLASSLAILHSRGMVHRDVSPRNVRCTQDGHVKLIDFGAMAPMGAAKQVVGTPPFIPPEALQLQALDGRSDLYALGALAYFMLTGRNAYPARALGQLKELWQSAPPALRTLEPALPEGLERLVLELMQLDRAGRPRSAAEVMERLSGIAGLSLAELPEVQRAYLLMPKLVGREPMLAAVREGLARAEQGTGESFWIEAERGLGRSRFLDACVLEAKLKGMVVLRAAAQDVSRRPYGLIRELCEQLLAAMPQRSEQGARPRRNLLAHLLPQLGTGFEYELERDGELGVQPERRHMQAALRDWLLSVAREKTLVLAVDDVDAADEPSAAVLGLLAHNAARRQLTLLLTATRPRTPNAVLDVIEHVSTQVALPPLDLLQTEELLRSVFGDAPHVASLAARMQSLAEGNPQVSMALCERLCERGLARYEAGGWSLPAELGGDALPESMTSAFVARVAALPDEARELCAALALTDAAALPTASFPLLLQHGDAALAHRAVAALCQAHVLQPVGDRFRFVRPEFSSLLRPTLSPEATRSLHGRLAQATRTASEPMLLARHLLLSGNERDAIARVLQLHARTSQTPELLDLLEQAVEAAERLALPTRTQLELRYALLLLASGLGDRETYLRFAPPVLERLASDAGLPDVRAGDPDASAQERFAAGMQRAQKRHEATPRDERGFAPAESITRLAVLSCHVAAMLAAVAQELELIEALPSLEPLRAHLEEIETVQQQLAIATEMQRARFDEALKKSVALSERLRQPLRGGLDESDAKELRMAQLFLQGLSAAGGGGIVPPALLSELEHVPRARVHAWRIRMAYELTQGNQEAALACQRRAELLQLQDGGAGPVGNVRTELRLHLYLEDVVGVKRLLGTIEGLAHTYPGWRPSLAIARSHYLRLQGDLPGALSALTPALEQLQPGRHIDWALAMGTHLELLIALGQHTQADALERRYAEQAASVGLRNPQLDRARAEAMLAGGRVSEALALIERCLADAQQRRTRGLYLGHMCETRVRVAVAMQDGAAVQQFMGMCATEYRGASNPLMSARYDRILREISAAGFDLGAASARADALRARLRSDDAAETVYGRMLTCIGPQERAAEGLRLLLEATGATTGHLFGLRGGELQLLSSIEALEDPQDLLATLTDYLRRELESEANATVMSGNSIPAGDILQRWVDHWGREFEPVLLSGEHEGEDVVVGVAAMHYESDERRVLRRGVLNALTQALLSDDVIDPITCVG